MIRVLLVDDEPLARERLRTLLEAEPGFKLAGECQNGLEALEAIARLRPDLALLDIQMPGLGGLEVAEALDGKAPLLVFVTAYDQYALAAFQHHALDFIQKPIDPARFHQAMDRVRTMQLGQALREQNIRLRAALEDQGWNRPPRDGLVVHAGDRYILVPMTDIHCLEATGNYVCLHCPKESYFLRDTLTAVEARLDPQRFARTHRSWLINLEKVVEARPAAKGSWTLLTQAGQEVPVSPTYREVVQAFLNRPSSRQDPLPSQKR